MYHSCTQRTFGALRNVPHHHCASHRAVSFSPTTCKPSCVHSPHAPASFVEWHILSTIPKSFANSMDLTQHWNRWHSSLQHLIRTVIPCTPCIVHTRLNSTSFQTLYCLSPHHTHWHDCVIHGHIQTTFWMSYSPLLWSLHTPSHKKHPIDGSNPLSFNTSATVAATTVHNHNNHYWPWLIHLLHHHRPPPPMPSLRCY